MLGNTDDHRVAAKVGWKLHISFMWKAHLYLVQVVEMKNFELLVFKIKCLILNPFATMEQIFVIINSIRLLFTTISF